MKLNIKLSALIIGLGITLAACGGDNSAASAYCEVSANKYNLCVETLTDSELSEFNNSCVSVANTCSTTPEEYEQAESNIKAMSCGEYVNFLNDALNNPNLGAGCG